MPLFQQRPPVVQAHLFDPLDEGNEKALQVVRWCGGRITDAGCEFDTPYGKRTAAPGMWIVRDERGEFHAVPPEAFESRYGQVDVERLEPERRRRLVPEGTRWRVGRHLGRTVYEQRRDSASDDDRFLGIFDNAETAALVCALVNRAGRSRL